MTKQIHNEIFDKTKLIAVLKKQTPHLDENKITWYDDGWDFFYCRGLHLPFPLIRFLDRRILLLVL